MPRSKNYKKHKKLRRQSRKIKGGFSSSYSVPTNTIPFNQHAGGLEDPSSSINQLPTRLLPNMNSSMIGGGKRRKSKHNKSKHNKSKHNKSKHNKSKIIRGGGITDILLGSSTGALASQALTSTSSASTTTAINLFSGIPGVNPATYVQPVASNTNVLV